MSTTDDTRQRSVAEIIGWTLHPGDPWEPSTRYWSAPDGSSWPKPTVTPDDMLAWLREQGFDVQLWWWSMSDQCSLAIDGRLDFYTNAPTLHAALEAAVRAVAEASDE